MTDVLVKVLKMNDKKIRNSPEFADAKRNLNLSRIGYHRKTRTLLNCNDASAFVPLSPVV